MSMSLLSPQRTAAADAGAPPIEAQVPTDLLAGLLMELTDAPPGQPRDADSLPSKVYPVMAVTTLLTFVTLRTSYQFFFSHQLFG
jgi:hypothetical protein